MKPDWVITLSVVSFWGYVYAQYDAAHSDKTDHPPCSPAIQGHVAVDQLSDLQKRFFWAQLRPTREQVWMPAPYR